jgi:mannosyl-oligosaccharide alpha-1,2-mannosidase
MCRNAWGASAVDALSTALVMQQKDIVNQILEYVPTIDYWTTETEVSLFETTIRYLGGMISGYDFLTGPLEHLAENVSDQKGFLC